MIAFRYCTVVACDDKLRLGSHVILSIKVYVKSSAFSTSANTNSSHLDATSAFINPEEDDAPRGMWNEGEQTQTEKMLRDRMSSLLEMFKILGLFARKASPLKAMKAKSGTEIDKKMRKLSVQPNGGAGSGDEEELEDDELDLIYQK